MTEQLGAGGIKALHSEREAHRVTKRKLQAVSGEISRLQLLVAKLSAEGNRNKTERDIAVKRSRKWQHRAMDSRRELEKLTEQTGEGDQ